MPAVQRRNQGVYVELPPDLREQLKQFARARGQTQAAVHIEALRRHFAYPPPAGPAPLPDTERAAKPARKKTSEKKSKSP